MSKGWSIASRRGEGDRRAAARQAAASRSSWTSGTGVPCAWPTPAKIGHSRPALVREAEGLYANLRRGSQRALRALEELAGSHPDCLRVSRRLESWVAARRAGRRRQREYDRFKASLTDGASASDLLKQPLLPYQVDGVLHLAFRERALLADDMGLGKTVQAIAACALLRRLRGIERVLVVSPASVKAEWEEQIARFSELPACVVAGNRLARRAAYRSRTFFTLCNYEQILVDGDEILDLLEPEIVILDEAQRIKNWQTKTANAVKRLHSRYAFVLTGTPLENRIDEIYSIVEFLDPELLGLAVPLQPGVLRAGRQGPPDRLPESRAARRSDRPGDAAAAQGRGGEPAPGPDDEDLLRSHDRHAAGRV